jgi:hypothetical protein
MWHSAAFRAQFWRVRVKQKPSWTLTRGSLKGARLWASFAATFTNYLAVKMRFTPSVGQFAVAVLFLAAKAQCSAENDVVSSQAPLVSESFVCRHPPFRAQLISTSPLLIYLHDFLTQQELQYLQHTRYSFPLAKKNAHPMLASIQMSSQTDLSSQ